MIAAKAAPVDASSPALMPANSDPKPVGRQSKRGVSRKYAMADHEHALSDELLKLLDGLESRVSKLERPG